MALRGIIHWEFIEGFTSPFILAIRQSGLEKENMRERSVTGYSTMILVVWPPLSVTTYIPLGQPMTGT